MRNSLRRDLTAALKARDRVATAALRSALTAIENAEAPSVEQVEETESPVVADEHIAGAAAGPGASEVRRKQLTEADVRAIVESEIHERSATASEYERIGRDEYAQRLRSEAEVLSRYLAPDR